MRLWLALALVTVTAAQAEELPASVETQVSISAAVSFFYRKDHPAKLFKCWGRPDEHGVADAVAGADRQGNEGSVLASASAKGFSGFLPQQVQWSSTFGEDFVYRIAFQQTLSEESSTWVHHECNTRNDRAKVAGVSNKLRSTATLRVPDGIWLLRLAPSLKVATPLSKPTLKVLNAFPVLRGPLPPAVADQPVSATLEDQPKYFVVRPGAQVHIEVEWSTQSANDESFEANVEATFIGYNRCIAALGPPDEFGARLSRFKNDLAAIRDEGKLAVSVGCLRNPAYLGPLLYENDGAGVVELLNQLQAYADSSLDGDEERFARRVVTLLTLYDLSRTVLADLKSYCDKNTVSLFEDMPELAKLEVRGYHFAGRQYAKAAYLLQMADNPGVKSLLNVTQALQVEGKTYRDAMSVVDTAYALRASQFAIYELTGDRLHFLGQVQSMLKQLPSSKVGKHDRERLVAHLARASVASSRLDGEIRRTLRKFGYRRDEPVDAEPLSEAADEYAKMLAETGELMRKDVLWFKSKDGTVEGVDTAFTEDLKTLHLSLTAANAKVIEMLLGSELRPFLRIEELEKLRKEVGTCLTEA